MYIEKQKTKSKEASAVFSAWLHLVSFTASADSWTSTKELQRAAKRIADSLLVWWQKAARPHFSAHTFIYKERRYGVTMSL